MSVDPGSQPSPRGQPGIEPHVGDRIVVESEHVGRPPREGVIEEVLMATLPRYRVRWDDGHTSIFTPSAGAARVEGDTEREQGSQAS